MRTSHALTGAGGSSKIYLNMSCTVLHGTASLADEDIMSDSDENNHKDRINSSTFDNRTPKCVNNGKRLCNGDTKLLIISFIQTCIKIHTFQLVIKEKILYFKFFKLCSKCLGFYVLPFLSH